MLEVSNPRWVMRQTWSHLLFAHWQVPNAVLRRMVPAELELDLYDGSAWIGVVPFLMTGIRARGLPLVPGLNRTLELNVRTYVRHGGHAGVYFFSLDAENRAIVRGARISYGLPYFHARMLEEGGRYASVRTHRGAPPAEFRADYRPDSPVFTSKPGSLEFFLTERYCLFTALGGRVQRGDIYHQPWPLQVGRAEIAVNTMVDSLGMELRGSPLLHYAESLNVLLDRIRTAS